MVQRMINHPPVTTIFKGGINHSQMGGLIIIVLTTLYHIIWKSKKNGPNRQAEEFRGMKIHNSQHLQAVLMSGYVRGPGDQAEPFEPSRPDLGVFHSHGGSSIAGWFMRENPNIAWMIWRYPYFRKPSFLAF